MNVLRSILAAVLVAVLAVLLAYGNFIVLAASAIAAFLAWTLLLRDLRKCIWRAVPVFLFCAILAILELIAHRSLTLLALKTFVCYAILSLGVQLVPWTVMVRSVSPQSRFFAPFLFFLFIYHHDPSGRNPASAHGISPGGSTPLPAWRYAIPSL
jgi:predicted lysophospholipase L1 biosynthesis ABC-type transport system permease subunit